MSSNRVAIVIGAIVLVIILIASLFNLTDFSWSKNDKPDPLVRLVRVPQINEIREITNVEYTDVVQIDAKKGRKSVQVWIPGTVRSFMSLEKVETTVTDSVIKVFIPDSCTTLRVEWQFDSAKVIQCGKVGLLSRIFSRTDALDYFASAVQSIGQAQDLFIQQAIEDSILHKQQNFARKLIREVYRPFGEVEIYQQYKPYSYAIIGPYFADSSRINK